MLQNAQTQSVNSFAPHAAGNIGQSPATPYHFHTRILDDAPHLLEQSYRLRYRVYCLERGFLPAEDYPNKLERDEFDRYSLHLGVVDSEGELAATARLVQVGPAGLPLFRRCTIFDDETELYRSNVRAVEVSRLSVSRSYRRQGGGTSDPFRGATEAISGGRHRRENERRRNEEMVVSLYRGLYQASKRMGFTHWLVATETSLQRLVVKYGFPFRQVGPEGEYFGRVAPYIMNLSDFDAVILSRRIPMLNDFLSGLEHDILPGGHVMASA